MPSIRPAHRLLAALLLFLAICGPAWGYGWTGHWRVLEAAWPSLGTNVCEGRPHAPPISPEVLDLGRPDIGMAAALGAVISDAGYITQGTGQFSDLMHYVGTGNYLDNVIQATCDRYGDDPAMIAFLAGLRSHYWADRIGHHEGTNVAVALLSDKNRDHSLTHMVYERDVAMHKRLELGAFSIYDLRYGTLRVATAFVAGANPGRLVERVAYVLRQAAQATWGDAGVAFVPTYPMILAFIVHVTDSVCDAVQATYGTAPARPDLGTMVETCKKTVRTVKPTDPQKIPSVARLAAEGFLLARQHELEAIYEASIRQVVAALRAGGRTVPNYNLDTNLPAIGGQYQLADAAYLLLGAQADGSCDPAHAESIVDSAMHAWRSYQPAGLCMRAAAGAPMPTLACAQPASAIQERIAQLWLSDLTPVAPSRTNACRPSTIRTKQTAFHVDAHCAISAKPPARAVDLMLACMAARNGSSNLHSDDAFDRLRLAPRVYGTVDPATGLYR